MTVPKMGGENSDRNPHSNLNHNVGTDVFKLSQGNLHSVPADYVYLCLCQDSKTRAHGDGIVDGSRVLIMGS